MSINERTEIDQEVVDRYLNNEGTAEDREKIKGYFASNQEAAALEKASLGFWKKSAQETDLTDYDEGRILDRLNHLLRLDDAKTAKEQREKFKWYTLATRIAAGLFIPLLFFSYWQWSGSFENQQTAAYSSIYSPLGARTKFHLPDGSEGWLNGGSSLQFPTTFLGKYREVRLEGEAYFDVFSNPEKPFVVTTRDVKVVAVGTSFNVNAYVEDKTSSVMLESGKVSLFKSEDQHLNNTLSQLDTGYQFTYFKELDSHQIEAVDVYKSTAWKEGLLVFREDLMVDIVDRLNRWYNVEITIKDKRLETYTFRATFQDETLDEVLKLLKLSSPIKVEEVGREILEDNTFGKRKINLSL